MRIVGIGMDATEIPRIESTIARYGDRFLHRILTDHEYAYCMRRRFPAPHVAGRGRDRGLDALAQGLDAREAADHAVAATTSGPRLGPYPASSTPTINVAGIGIVAHRFRVSQLSTIASASISMSAASSSITRARPHNLIRRWST